MFFTDNENGTAYLKGNAKEAAFFLAGLIVVSFIAYLINNLILLNTKSGGSTSLQYVTLLFIIGAFVFILIMFSNKLHEEQAPQDAAGKAGAQTNSTTDRQTASYLY